MYWFTDKIPLTLTLTEPRGSTAWRLTNFLSDAAHSAHKSAAFGVILAHLVRPCSAVARSFVVRTEVEDTPAIAILSAHLVDILILGPVAQLVEH